MKKLRGEILKAQIENEKLENPVIVSLKEDFLDHSSVLFSKLDEGEVFQLSNAMHYFFLSESFIQYKNFIYEVSSFNLDDLNDEVLLIKNFESFLIYLSSLVKGDDKLESFFGIYQKRFELISVHQRIRKSVEVIFSGINSDGYTFLLEGQKEKTFNGVSKLPDFDGFISSLTSADSDGKINNKYLKQFCTDLAKDYSIGDIKYKFLIKLNAILSTDAANISKMRVVDKMSKVDNFSDKELVYGFIKTFKKIEALRGKFYAGYMSLGGNDKAKSLLRFKALSDPDNTIQLFGNYFDGASDLNDDSLLESFLINDFELFLSFLNRFVFNLKTSLKTNDMKKLFSESADKIDI